MSVAAQRPLSRPEHVRAGIYLRISRDPDDKRTGVARQLKDCRAIGDHLEWDVVEVFDENNTSATRNKEKRVQYQRYLDWVRTGRLDAIIFWEFDRYTRDPREADDLLNLARDHGLRAATSTEDGEGQELDLLSPNGRHAVINMGSSARRETEMLSKRMRKRFDQKAAEGLPHGAVPYGWRREREIDPRTGTVISSRDVLDEQQAQVIRDALAMLRAGRSLRAAAKELNNRGTFSPRLSRPDANGERHPVHWESATLKQVLLRARNAGLRVHRGQVVEGVSGNWAPIIDRNDYDWLVATLTDPTRRTNKGRERRHLLSGLLTCGRCGEQAMRAQSGRMNKGKRQPPAYACTACFRVRRKQAEVDASVKSAMIKILKTPGALDRLVTGDPEAVKQAEAQRDAATARMAMAADRFATGEWTEVQVDRINTIAKSQIEAAQTIIDANRPPALPYHVAGPNAEAEWGEASLDEKRALVGALVHITVMPSGPGRKFDSKLIVIEPANR